MQVVADAPTRLLQPKHQDWIPREHQALGATFLVEHACGALFFSPGLGKTSSTLAAFRDLVRRGVARRMLVIAPLRVCQSVWRQEADKWNQFRDLRFSLLHGRNKDKNLRADADVFLINPEGIDWLVRQFPPGVPLPFDTLCIDELTKFKNSQAKRFKKLRSKTKHFARRWGLTGTPAANGYEDLFGQMLILDDGASLGRYITHYRERYFQPDYTGYNWTLRKGCKEKIQARIAPYVLHMRTEDCVDVPPVTDHIHEIVMPEKAWKHYKQLEEDMLTELHGHDVAGDNTGAVYNKLSQMANGAVYSKNFDDEKRRVLHVHDSKLDALEELVEELGGEQLLVAYEFQHDLTMIRKRLGENIPHLGKGTAEKKSNEIIAQWNAGELPILLAHPQSAAHGLNLQEGGAWNTCWFSPTWNLELYEQFIDRIRRSGNVAEKIVNHLLIVKGTIDEVKLAALGQKNITQKDLLNALVTELHPHTAGDDAVKKTEETDMVKKLSAKKGSIWGKAPKDEDDLDPKRQETGEEETGEEEQSSGPKGWGAATKSAASSEEKVQRKKLRKKLGPKEPDPKEEDEGDEQSSGSGAMGLFSKSIQESFEAGGVPDELEEGGDAVAPAGLEEPPEKTEKQEKEETAEKAPEKPRKPRSRKAAPKADEKADSAPAAATGGEPVDYDQLADVLLGKISTKTTPELDMDALAVSLLKKMGERLQG